MTSARLPHAFLFSGSRGIGKTTMARILARAVNCADGPSPDPCGRCEPCAGILAGSNADVVEIDAASHNLVDDIRELRERVAFASMGSRYKVYILDEVHMLTRSAFNAFLKTLEEPPPNVVFILATTELHKVPETIRSRCQVLLFQRVGEDDIVGRLRVIGSHEGLTIPDDVLREIASSCRGGMRDAETALERILPVAQELGAAFDLDVYRSLVHRVGLDRVVEVVEALLRGAAAPALHFAEAVVDSGVDEREALGEILDVLRSILLLEVDGPESGLVAHSGELRSRLVALARNTDAQRLDAMIHAGLIGRERIRRLDDRRLVLEVTLLRMASAGQLPLLGDLVAALQSGAVPGPAAATDPGAVPVGAPVKAPGDLRAALVARLRQVKPMLVATVEAAVLDGPDDAGTVRLVLESGRRMHRDRLSSAPLQSLLREQLREILGRDVALRVVLGEPDAAESGATRQPPAAPEQPTERRVPGAAVRRIAEMFDGQILDYEGP